MIRNTFTLAFSFFFFIAPAFSQQGNNWFFPEKAAITFNNGMPVALPTGRVYTPDPNNIQIRPTESSASISDSKGNLLFYTDGLTVWNRYHEVMPNGKGLMGGTSSTQPATIVPDPGNRNRYYIFTTDDFQHTLKNGFRYSIVNMCLDEGRGDITEVKNILLLDVAGEKQCITKHANDTDYWVVTHKHFTDAFYAYLVTKDGIQPPVITHIGRVHESGLFAGTSSAIGQMKISPGGDRLALVTTNHTGSNHGNAIFETFSFSNQTGQFSNYVNLTAIIHPVFFGFYGGYGLAFSPDGKSIFITSTRGIIQMRYNNGWTYVHNIQNTMQVLSPIGGMQLGPDGIIYIAKGESYLSAIMHPDKVGQDIGYFLDFLFLDEHIATQSLPSFYDGFRYTHSDPDCPVTPPGSNGTGVPPGCNSTLFPNPAYDRTIAKSHYGFLKEVLVYDGTGRLVYQYNNINAKELEINTAVMAQGVYLVVIVPQAGEQCVKRFVKVGP